MFPTRTIDPLTPTLPAMNDFSGPEFFEHEHDHEAELEHDPTSPVFLDDLTDIEDD
jgi:hypothetical protein